MDWESVYPALFALPWALALGLAIFGTCSLKRHLLRPPNNMDVAFSLIPVTILKPLKGAEEGLLENLESFLALDYPDYEVIFSIADESDPATPIARKSMSRHPRTRSRLIIGQTEVGTNPKINNLMLSYESARNDWILISDSNVRARKDYLKRMVAHLDNDVGMVTGIVAGRKALGIGGRLEEIFLNTFYARGMILARDLGKPCVIGKSMLFRKSTAQRFGGLAMLGRYLAEDFMAGEAMRRLGLRVVIANEPVAQHIGSYTVEQFWSRHIRWGRIRKSQAPLAFAIEPLFGSIVSGMLGALALSSHFGLSFSTFFAAHLLAWATCDWIVHDTLRGRERSEGGLRGLLRWALIWLLREALAFPLWLQIASGSTVQWRGRRLKVQPGGLLESSG